MCGISAWLRLKDNDGSVRSCLANRESDVTDLERSLDVLHHRGPDARGAWLSADQCVGLGSVRLAIQDLTSAGDQPLHDPASDVHAVVNGEVYSYQKLRSQLETTHDFQSYSDSELIIAAYNYHGLGFLSHLRGEFALCLYDAKRKLFIAARDRYGVKPLYWTRIGGRLHFASEAKAFLPFGWRPEWDVRSIVEDGWLHDERTLFSGVNKIRAGHYMTCISFEHVEQEAYWDSSYPNKYHREIRSEEEMIQGVREHLIDAVSERLRADAKIGLYLSGGIDSAVIAGVTREILDRRARRGDSETALAPPPCFCVGFEENTDFDEMPIAQRTAESLGFPFFSRRMDEDSLADMFEEATYHAECLNPDLNTVAKFAVSKLAHDNGVKVVLSGEGSDEIFGGYPCFFPDFLREPDYSLADNQLDPITRRDLTEQAEIKVSAGFKGIDRSRITLASQRAKRMTNNLSITSTLWTVTLAHFAPWTKALGCVSIEETRANNPSVHALQRLKNEWHPLHGAEYIWSRSILPNWILTCLGDRMEMSHSVEGRPPFLDHHLAEYVNNLPPNMKIKYDVETDTVTEKWILREATRPWITNEVYRRKKHPFSAPYLYKAGGSMHKLLSRLVTRETLEQLGFVDVAKTLHTLDDAFSGHNPQSIRYCFIVAQLVTLSQQLGIATAYPPNTTKDRRTRDRPAIQASL